MYDVALRVLSIEEDGQLHLPLKLAIVNNKGCIYSAFHERNALQQCLKSMETLMHRCAAFDCGGLSQDDCCQIQMNIMLFSDRTSYIQSAPAA
jgi:hypothetical protein